MKILFKNLLRDIKKSRGQFISILIIVVLGVMFYTSINAMFRNLSNSSEKYYEEYRLADIWVDLYKAPFSVEEKVKKIPNVEKATGRIIQDYSINISEENATLRFVTLPDIKKDIVNDIVLQSGRYFSQGESNQCLLEEEFFKAHNLNIGDCIYPVINGDKLKLKIIGTVRSPEFIYTLKDSSELMPDSKKFGIIYIKQSLGEALFGYKGSINSISILLTKDSDIETVKKDIEKSLKEFGVKSVINREQHLSTMMLNEEIDKLKTMGSSFPIIFFIVAAVIIYIMMGRMVENQRVQIGVLKALGFTDLQLLFYYICYSALIAVIGSMIGSALGTYMGIGFTKLINQYFHLPLANAKIYLGFVIPASLSTLFFCLLGGYNSCKKIFKIMPSEAMKEKSPQAGKNIVVEKIKVLWERMSYLWKITLRNLFRYKGRAMLTSLGIMFSSAILLISLGMKDSVDFMVDQQYSNIQNYDIKINFSKLISAEELNNIKNIPHVTVIEPIFQTGIEISNGWRGKNILFTALIEEPEMYKVQDKDSKSVTIPDSGLLIPEKLADTLGAKQGDSVYIKFFFPGKEKKEVRIKGTVVQYIGSSTYSSIDSLNDLLGEGKVANSAVLRLDNKVFEEEVKNKLRDMPAVSSVESKEDSQNSLLKNMAVMDSSIAVLIILAAALLIAVVYNIATINIFEKQRELATLKVLGFKNKEVKKLIFNENYIITILGIIAGLPLGKWLGGYIMTASSTDSYSFPYIVQFKTYVITVILTIFFTTFTNFILMRKVKSIEMIEVLKNRE